MIGWRILGALLAIAFMAATVSLSGVPSVIDRSNDAKLRLSWRAVGERIEECRVPSEEELAALPAHMRQPKICDRRLAPFELEVRIDGEAVVSREIHASGAREDRPTYVFEEIPVSAGRHALEVRFAVAAGESPVATPALVLHREVDFAPNAIRLVTRDAETGDLALKSGRVSD